MTVTAQIFPAFPLGFKRYIYPRVSLLPQRHSGSSLISPWQHLSTDRPVCVSQSPFPDTVCFSTAKAAVPFGLTPIGRHSDVIPKSGGNTAADVTAV